MLHLNATFGIGFSLSLCLSVCLSLSLPLGIGIGEWGSFALDNHMCVLVFSTLCRTVLTNSAVNGSFAYGKALPIGAGRMWWVVAPAYHSVLGLSLAN